MEGVFESEPAGEEAMFGDLSADEGAAEQAPAASHDRLLHNINRLDSKRAGRSIIQRSEAAAEASEFDMAASEGAGVNVHDLLASLGDKARHATLRKEINKAKHQKKLPPPLEKPQAVKIQRKAGYEKTTKEVTRWENVVKQRRRADHQTFPLEKPDLSVETAADRTAAFVPQTPLEQEIAALLGGSTAVVPQGQVLSEAERRALAAMSLDEALERRRELAKHRALLSYQEAKHRRQNKIKSRKYRRVLKKERLKQHLKEFEQLKICDPEAALAKLNEMEKQRVEERMTQRHKNTGKWARLQAIKRKYDPVAREALAENLRIGRERAQKTAQTEDGDASSEDDAGPPAAVPVVAAAADPDNPWMSADAAPPSAADTYGGYSKFWSEQEAAKRRLREAERQENAEDVGSAEEEEEEDRPAPRVTAADIAAEPDSDEAEQEADGEAAEEEVQKSPKKKKAAKRKADTKADGKKKKKLKKDAKKQQDIDGIFDSYEKAIAKKTKQTLNKLTKASDDATSKKPKQKKTKERQVAVGSDDDEAQPGSEMEKMDASSERRATMTELEELSGPKAALEMSTEDLLGAEDPVPGPTPAAAAGAGKEAARSAPELDPARFMAVEPRHLRSLRPEGDDAGGDDALDDADDARMTIAEAFADDDVVAEFREEKEATIDADKPKDIDLALPGWGDWGGQNIKMSAKKRRRLLFRAPKGPARKDHHLGHVILSEKRNESLREHQPSELPHYVSSVAAFEASIRTPVGRTWLPARAHDQLTRPAVSTRAGTVIKPMDESSLLAGKARGRRRR